MIRVSKSLAYADHVSPSMPGAAFFLRSKKLACSKSVVTWVSRLLNLACLSFRAVSRTPSSPRDLITRLYVWTNSGSRPIAVPRRSTRSVSFPSQTPQQFEVPLCSPASQVLRDCLTSQRRACRDDGIAPSPTDPSLIRRMSLGSPGFREESFRKSVRVAWGFVGLTSNSPLTFDIRVAFPATGHSRPPQRNDFGAQYTARTFPCERFDWMVAHTDASLGAKAIGEILPRTKLLFATLLRLSLAHPVPVFQQTAITGGLSGVTRLDRPAGDSRQARNDSAVDAAPFSAIERQASHCHRVGRVDSGFWQIIRHRGRPSLDDPIDPQSNFRLSAPHAPPRPRMIAIFWVARIRENRTEAI